MPSKSYSAHFVQMDPDSAWVVVEETCDEHGDVIDCEEVSAHKTQGAAERKAERLNKRFPRSV